MDSTTTEPIMKLEPGVSEATNTMDSCITTTDPMEIEPASETDNIADSPMVGAANNADTQVNLAKTVRVFNMGGNSVQRKEQMQKQGRSIATLCRNSGRGKGPDVDDEMRRRFEDARLYLDWLDTNVDMTPHINSTTGVKKILEEIVDPKNKVPEELVNQAKEMLNKYEADNWGQDNIAEEEVTPQAAFNEATGFDEIQLPPDNDPIFGVGGIMYGIVVDTSGRRKDYRLRADIPRKSAKVYGHNDIALGTWFPLQINALFWGAHGARMGGIAGSVLTGAWSIVVASTYEDLDTDNGEILYYSGSNSHENTNPRQPAPASQGTKALLASINTRNPVRVLRSGGASNTRNQNPHLPVCGLRYDGLYRVIHSRRRTNRNGGLYDQFKLERLPGQTPLAELERTSPTTQQVFAHDNLRRRN